MLCEPAIKADTMNRLSSANQTKFIFETVASQQLTALVAMRKRVVTTHFTTLPLRHN